MPRRLHPPAPAYRGFIELHIATDSYCSDISRYPVRDLLWSAIWKFAYTLAYMEKSKEKPAIL